MEAAQLPTKWINVFGEERVLVGIDILQAIGEDIKQAVPSVSRYVVVTDDNVAGYYLEQVKAVLVQAGLSVFSKVVPSGEVYKTRATKETVENWMLENHFGRDTCLVALGGGVVGDLVGFVAATYMRGIPVVQIPTSLLGMVDAAIGGKTGVDTVHGKNPIGAFHQPVRVYIHLGFLMTLPLRQIANGMAEVIKTAAISDEESFDRLERMADNLMAGDLPSLYEAVLASVQFKAQVVSADEKESGLREVLNFGHSVGHAIEALMQPALLHGEAVAIGMVKEAEIARHLGILSQANFGRLVRCIMSYSLPVTVPTRLPLSAILGKMAVDKKNKGGKKAISLLQRIGGVKDNRASIVNDDVIIEVISPALEIVKKTLSTPITLTVPGSKSLSNRALLMACLGEGSCRIRGLLHSDDTKVMLEALQHLSTATFDWEEDGEVLHIVGCAGKLTPTNKELYLGNAGTASRFLTTVCTIVGHHLEPDKSEPTALLRNHITITGNKRMQRRPIGDLVVALRENGCVIKYLNREGCLPLQIQPNSLRGGLITLSAETSSQFVSSVLLSAPCAREPVSLKLTGTITSEPFIDMTVRMMAAFGVNVKYVNNDHYEIPRGVYKNPAEYHLESDASSATYPLAIAAITGGTVTVEGVGSNSLQGDAQFYTILERMGCHVSQTPTSTTVRAPADGILKPIASVDMSTMTDAFMTAAVLMALAPPGSVSRITNISNQRDKECNRIAAMVTELGKLGIASRELPDGIEIEGCHPDLVHGATVECYDDHRIAMSFAVLGCRIPGIVISDKMCVLKTFPEFWDLLGSCGLIDVKVPNDVEQLAAEQLREGKIIEIPRLPNGRYLLGKSVIVIGMRGAGKSHLGAAAARNLGVTFVDMDMHFEKRVEPIAGFVEKNGWPAFRSREVMLLAEALKRYKTQAIISCGGGIVETQEGRNLLQDHGVVIQVKRNINDIAAYLASDSTRANLGEDVHDVWRRREPLYDSCSLVDFVVVEGDKDWPAVNADFIDLVKRISNLPTRWAPMEGQVDAKDAAVYAPKFFLSLTGSTVRSLLKDLPVMSEGVDALELRVDLLENQQHAFVAEQFALLRRNSRLPIIFTVRSKYQGGAFSEQDEEALFKLLHLGVRLGSEYVDMESCWSIRSRQHLLAHKGISKIIASFHDATGSLSMDELRVKLQELHHDGKADILKLVGLARDVDDNLRLREIVNASEHARRTIGVCLGPNGKLSRVLNTFFTPVTHRLLALKAAPGQMSVADIVRTRTLVGQLTPLKFFLFGTPIAQSLSPLMHNTAFKTLGFPHTYSLCETSDVNEIRAVLASDAFGGASITIPLKEMVLPLVHVLSPAAKAIGAVNTLAKHGGKNGRVYGDNTDWIGIHEAITRACPVRPRVALVLGAGGTARAACYALNQLGVDDLIIFNRTMSKAQTLALEFNGSICHRLEAVGNVDLIVSTVPVAAQQEALPARLFATKPVVCDVTYKPRMTPLLVQAQALQCPIVHGVDVLIAQGLCQFVCWTGTQPCRATVTEATLAALASS